MIVFDLACPAGHVFEAWFGSSDDYEGQRKRGLVSCPVCGSDAIDKAVMAPRVSPKGNAVALADAKAMLAKMAALQQEMLAKSSYVGRDFAAQARAMHEGDRPQAAIYGEVTAPEAKSLIEDGVPVAPLPLPVRPPGQTN